MLKYACNLNKASHWNLDWKVHIDYEISIIFPMFIYPSFIPIEYGKILIDVCMLARLNYIVFCSINMSIFYTFICDWTMLTLDDNTLENKTFFTRTNSEFANQLVLHKSTNTICGTAHLTNSEFVLMANVLLSHV